MDMSGIVIQEQPQNQHSSENMLILSLSMGDPDNLTETTYLPPRKGEPCIVTNGYALEPVPQYLAATVGLDHVLMIETARTKSVEDYFKKSLHTMTNIHADGLSIDEYRLTDEDKASLADVDEIVRKIQAYVNDHPRVTIYLDMHGGLRGNTEILMTIFSMLPMEQLANGTTIRIDPTNIYSIAWRGVGSKENKIIQAGEAYQLMDLVAGVHEFVEYGRTESLKNYAQGNESIQPMVKAMDMISDALAMADIELFDKGLSELKSELKACKKERYSGNSQSTADIFIRLVDQEYGRIINSRNKQLDKIRWCMNKKFYQLAATMCEAQIPWYLSETGVFDFSNAIRNGFAQKREMHDDQDKFLGAFNEFVNNYNTIQKGSEIYYQVYWDKDGNYYYLSCDEEYNETVAEFLTLHLNIKKTRNYMNHLLSFEREPRSGSGRRVEIYRSPGELDAAVERYLELVDALHNDPPRLELQISRQPVR